MIITGHRAMEMTGCTVVDLDKLLLDIGHDQLGAGYVLDTLDTSGVKLRQLGVVYQGQDDWWSISRANQEVFDNKEALSVTWNYTQEVAMESRATWVLQQIFKSEKYLPFNLTVEYPAKENGKHELKATFDTTNLNLLTRSDSCASEWTVKTMLTVKPHSSVRACADVKLCLLNSVHFHTGVEMFGVLTIKGHKKRKFGKKKEVVCSIAEVFADREGFHGNHESQPTSVTFSVMGLCSGRLGTSAEAVVEDLQTLV